ncbi:MAG: response regulator [Clostridiales bacterium]|nr:response regulator [Clostridiales bacterium]
MRHTASKSTIAIAIVGSIIFAVVLTVGTIQTGLLATKDTEKAVEAVSLLYLDELAGRREQVVSANLSKKIKNLDVALGLMTEDDLSDLEHLQAYQAKMKKLYDLEKFAFVDEDGLIYTSLGMQTNIDDYSFDYKTITGPEISILNTNSEDKKVIIAVPVSDKSLEGKPFLACFMEIDMDEMLEGVSMQSDDTETTFCNIYTRDGIALTNVYLGGLAVEDNLLDAMKIAEFSDGTYEQFLSDFQSGKRGEVNFTYNGTTETLSFVPVSGTDWMLTYLIRETVIADQIRPVSQGIVVRSVIQSLLAALVLISMFVFIIIQIRKNNKLSIAKETADAENRVKQEQMEEKLSLQSKLLEEEKRRSVQDSMITAMSTDYRSVYYVDLDKDEGVCYRGDPKDKDQTKEGVRFPFHERFSWYADNSVDENYREGFKNFIDPDNLREGLGKEPILAYRYLAKRDGMEYYEMIRAAGVRHKEDRADHLVHAIGLGLTVIDAEMRESMAQKEALDTALASAEQANKAKTAFLSNMSHEIRTPMNAIIGLDNIALNDPETPPKTKEYLEKIGTSAEHLLNLINDILDMSRIESGRMVLKNEEFSFSHLIESINTMFSGQCLEKQQNYICNIEGHVDEYYIGDNMKLRQVLINILGNAVKFTPEGGSISLDIKRTAQFDNKSTLQFVIRDNGIGISEEFLPRLFETFAQEEISYTNKYGSSGLGLAITKNIIDMMNGSIEVSSEKDKGTTFTVSVTLTDSDRTSGIEKELHIHPSEMSVLIIDNDPVACEHAKIVLEKAGIAAEVASSGAEGIEMVKLRHVRHQPYNLILVDWKMPEMDGVETSKRIREIVGNESAIIILTAYKWDDILEEALKSGVDSFLAKPLFATNVIEEFINAYRKKMGAGERKLVDLTGLRVLVAEDVEVNADILQMILESREIDSDIAENGKVAVDLFASHPENYYAAILMDMRMPEMDGLEATRKIRAMDRADAKEIPVIALTANAFDEDVQRSLQAGLNAHLTKPIQPEVLFETLESLVKVDAPAEGGGNT